MDTFPALLSIYLWGLISGDSSKHSATTYSKSYHPNAYHNRSNNYPTTMPEQEKDVPKIDAVGVVCPPSGVIVSQSS